MNEEDKFIFGLMFFALATNAYAFIVWNFRPSLFTPITYIIRNYPFLVFLAVVNEALLVGLILHLFALPGWRLRRVVDAVFYLSVVAILMSLVFFFTAQRAIGIYVGIVLLLVQGLAHLLIKIINRH